MQVVVHIKAIIYHVAWQSEHGELGDMEFDPDFIERFAFPFCPSCYWLHPLAYLDKMRVTQMHCLSIYLFFFFFLKKNRSRLSEVLAMFPQLSLWQFIKKMWAEWALETLVLICLVREKTHFHLHRGQEEQGGFVPLRSFQVSGAAVQGPPWWGLRHAQRESMLWSKWRCQLLVLQK